MRDAYDDAFAEYYDRITRHKDYEAEVTALARLIDEECGRSPARILDVGCGTGTHAALLAERGYAITAIDQSPAMARRARAKAPAVRVEEGDIRDLPEDGFTFAMSLFNVVNCLETLDALIEFLTAVAARLVPGAALLVEAWNPAAVIAEPPTTVERTYEDGADTITRTVVPRPDFMRQRLDLDYVIEIAGPDGRPDTDRGFTVTHRLVLFTPLELEFALERAGFVDTRVLTALPELRPAGEADRMLAFRSRKAGA